jgi:hypothetical protein
MRHRFPFRRVTPRQPVLATLWLLLCSATAWAETSPYVLGASETISHDSNVVRLPDGAAQPASLYAITDWVASTALLGGIDQPFGRQRVYGNVSVRNNHYRYNSVYSNLSYGLAGALDWSTVERVSGTVSLSSNRNLASFDRRNSNTPNIAKNIEQTNQFDATARVGVVTDLTFEGGYTHQGQHFSEVGDRLDQNVVSLGLHYRIGGELGLGAGLRLTSGRYPDRNDSIKGRNLDLSANWIPSPISNLTARLSLGKTDHSAVTALNFSGATGTLAWNWKPTGKLTFNTQMSRATGNESSFATGASTPTTAQADNSRLTSTLGLNANYEATAKILLNTGYSRSLRKLTDSTPTSAADRLSRWQIGARYLPTRTTELSCNVSRDSRRADPSTLTYSYSANTVSCAAQISVQP